MLSGTLSEPSFKSIKKSYSLSQSWRISTIKTTINSGSALPPRQAEAFSLGLDQPPEPRELLHEMTVGLGVSSSEI